MVLAGLMENIMSKTNDISKLDHAKLENRVLADSELYQRPETVTH
jgi:hypothetical protein